MGGEQVVEKDGYMPIKNIVLIIIQALNQDVSVEILNDYVSYYIYIQVYIFKWSTIYLTALMTVVVVILIFKALTRYVIGPVLEITDMIKYKR